MLFLSIECSTRKTGIALLRNNEIVHKKIWESKDASSEILPVIDVTLKKTNLTIQMFDYFVVSSGPGSWTGIRLGLALVYGLAIGNEKKIFGVSNLEAMAYEFRGEKNIGVFLPSTGDSVHYGFFILPDQLGQRHGKFYTCKTELLPQKLEKSRLIAGPDEKILSLFCNTGKKLVKMDPDPVMNAVLAYERIKNSVKPRNQPYYEK